MRRMFILLFAVMLVMPVTTGCGEQKSSSKKPSHTAQRQPAPRSGGAGPKQTTLPPAGHPLVGHKPPMPKPVIVTNPSYRVETFVSGLQIPWDMAFVSHNRVYVTERPGRVRIIENGKLRAKPYAMLNVHTGGEGGLLGIALHPNYPNPKWVYLMYTYDAGGTTYNRISRFTDTGSGLANEQSVVTRIPAGFIHNGGIIRFGPDGMLYAGTGDTHQSELAQKKSSLAGKILRMTPDGAPPKNNPFSGLLVYAYGLRNVQGLAWNPENDDLWATMHGPTGEFGLYAKDSVFIVYKGTNCGWPRVLGVTNVPGMDPPVIFYPDSAVPPGGAIFYRGSLMPNLRGNFFFSSLKGEHMERVVLSGPRRISRIEWWFATGTHAGKYGRLRAVAQGPDGAIYVSTSNRDGRGDVHPGDDRILRISPK